MIILNLCIFLITAFAPACFSNDSRNENVSLLDINDTNLKSAVRFLPTTSDAEKEHKYSLSIFLILFVIILSILLVHILLVTKLRYIPDSLSIIFLGSVIGLVLYVTGSDWRNEEAFSPNAFFLLLLPPIIFESGYNLHKGNFFANIFSILIFAVFGTLISAVVIGGGIYVLGQAQLIYNLSATESFAFGSLISAVDPVATLAIFQAIKVDPILYMLVFGESMLNDAVSIVLTTAILEYDQKTSIDNGSQSDSSTFSIVLSLANRFTFMFFGSAVIGIVAGLLSAILLKYVNLHNTPSLEYGIMLIFAYLPYSLTEGVHLSGIMAILFCGITMSHYTHYNLSAVTQVTVQQTFRALSFIAEACVFAYLGMAPFTFPMLFHPAFVCWSIVLCLISRALNVFPLSTLVNFFREHKITRKMQFLMWFSGLRGAIAFALSLHTSFSASMTRRIVVTTTYCVVLFTTAILGGSTKPLTMCLNKRQEKYHGKSKKNRRKRKRGEPSKNTATSATTNFTLSKTIEMGSTVDSYSEMTEVESFNEKFAGSARTRETRSTPGLSGVKRALSGLARFDDQFLRPFFVRKFTQREKAENRTNLANLASQWYEAVRNLESGEEDEETLLFDQQEACTSFSTSLPVNETSTNNNNTNYSYSNNGNFSKTTAVLELDHEIDELEVKVQRDSEKRDRKNDQMNAEAKFEISLA